MLLTPLAIGALISLAGLLIYRYLIEPLFLSPLAKLPTAHLSCSLSSRWLRWQQDHQNEAKSLFAAHSKHGPVVRIGPNEVSVNSQEGLREIYTAGLEKHIFYQGKFENFGTANLVSTLDHRTHSIEKRMLSSVYAKSYVQHSPDVAALSRQIIFERFLPLLQQYRSTQSAVNVMELFQWAGMDFMSAYNFGISRATDFLRDGVAREAYLSQWIKYRDGDFTGDKAVVEGVCMEMLKAALEGRNSKTVSEATDAVVAKRFHSQLVTSSKQAGGLLTDDSVMTRCASEMLDHMIATHETFSIILTYVMYQLSLDPSIQATLRKELFSLDPPICGNDSATDLPAPEQIDSLPLLNAVLLETLRLYAPTPGRLPRVAPPDGLHLHDYYIPAGTTVSCNAHSLHRKEDVFPRAFEWVPQRWMGGEHRSALGPGFSAPATIRRYMWAFGSGGRMCIGSNWAIQILKLLLASIYTDFTTTILDDEGIEQSDTLIAGPKSGKLILQFHGAA